jgi:hypothetical protein
MRHDDTCLICHKEKFHWHHIVKRKLQPKGIRPYQHHGLVPLCPKHHKLADLGRIKTSELFNLERLERVIDEILEQDVDPLTCKRVEKESWEAQYFDWINSPMYRQVESLGYSFECDIRDFPQYKRAARVSIWLDSGPDVGMYLIGNEMFSYLKKGVPTFTRYARQ